MRIEIEGLDRLRSGLRDLERQMPFIVSKAINEVAFKVRDAEIGEIAGTLENVKPWTLRGVMVKTSTKRDLEAVIGSKTGIRGTPGKWDNVMRPHIAGGSRINRKAERALQAKGMMPAGMLAVPGPDTKLDRYGNLSKATWMKLIQLQQHRKLFVALGDHNRTRHLSPGIYERTDAGHKVKPIVLFVTSARYTKRLDWFGQARRAVSREFPAAFARAVEYARRTAR